MLDAIVAISLLLLVNAVGVLLVLFQLPGTWLILGMTGLTAWWLRDQELLGWWTLGIMLVLALLGELIETGSGAIGSRQAGGSRRGALLAIPAAIVGATLGGSLAGSLALAFVWAVPVWLLAVLAGGSLGAALGAVVGDRIAGRSWEDSRRSALGAAIGRLGGTVGKVAVAAVMWAVAVIGLVL